MATLFLIRHGLTAVTGSRLYGRAPGVHLDERGRRQAAALVERFDGIRLGAVYSSPLERCVETVQPLAASRGLEVRTSEALVEMDAGRWTGRTLRSLSRLKLWDVVQRNPSAFVFPNGEGFVEAEARLIDELRRIASRHRGGRVAIGTHGDLVRVAVAHFAGAPLDRFQRVASDPASVSVVRIERGVPRILLVNDTGGLRRFATPAARTRGGSVEGRPPRAPARRKLRG